MGKTRTYEHNGRTYEIPTNVGIHNGSSVRAHYTYLENGKKRNKKITLFDEISQSNLNIAGEKAQQIKEAVKDGTFSEAWLAELRGEQYDNRMTLGQGFDIYLEVLDEELALGIRSPSGHGKYSRVVKNKLKTNLPLDNIIDELTIDDLHAFRKKLHKGTAKNCKGPMSIKSAEDVMGIWQACCNYLLKKDRIQSTPFLRYERYSDDDAYHNQVEFFIDDQLDAIVRNAIELGMPNFADLTIFIYETGMRISEAIAITENNIDLDTRSVRIEKACTRRQYSTPKNRSSTRTIPLSDVALSIVNKRLSLGTVRHSYNIIRRKNTRRRVAGGQQSETGSFLFYSDHRKTLYRSTELVNKHYNKVLEAITRKGFGVFPEKIHYYNLRHSWACRTLAFNQLSTFEVAQRLGHQSEKMLFKHYADVLRFRAVNQRGFAGDALYKEWALQHLNTAPVVIHLTDEEQELMKHLDAGA